MLNKIIFAVIILLAALIWEPFHHIVCHEHGDSIRQNHHGAAHCCFTIDLFSDNKSNDKHCLNHSHYLTPDILQKSSYTINIYAGSDSFTLKPPDFYENIKCQLYYNLPRETHRLEQNVDCTVLLI